MARDEGTRPWVLEKFDPSWNEGVLLEASSFSTPFRKDREVLREYLQEVWPTVKRALKKFGVSCELNLEEGSMAVSTTRKTRDPCIVVKARDLTRLLARSVPAPQALKLLSDDDIGCDIIKIGNLIRNRKRFSMRRDRILGPNMSTLQAIEDFTGCYILVQGSTVSAMGSFRGLEQVRKIVEACIKNKKNPLSHIQELRTEREYALMMES